MHGWNTEEASSDGLDVFVGPATAVQRRVDLYPV